MERSGGGESDQLPEEAPDEQVVDDQPGEHDETGSTPSAGDSDAPSATGNPNNAG